MKTFRITYFVGNSLTGGPIYMKAKDLGSVEKKFHKKFEGKYRLGVVVDVNFLKEIQK